MGSFLGPTGAPVNPAQSSIGVPPANFQAQAAAETAGQKAAGWFADFWAYFHASNSSGLGLVWSVFISAAQSFLAIIVKFYSLFQGQDVPGFYTLASSVLGDLLGVEFEINVSGFGKGGATNRQGNLALGGAFYSVLTSLIAPQLPLTPAGGLQAAQGFLGFLISFAMRQGNIDVISSLIPEEYRIGEGVKEYGENLSRALGIGRLARLAFTPLINTLIADPLKWQLNSQYTPTLLSEGQLIRASLRGIQTTPDLNTALSWLGHNQANVDALTQESITQLNVADVYRFYAAGQIDRPQAIQYIVKTGTDEPTASLMLEAADLADGAAPVQEQVAYLTSAFLARQIDSQTYQTFLSQLPISTARQAQLVSYTTQRIELPTKQLTLAEMQSAFLDGLIDLTELETFLLAEGYTTAAAQLYVIQTLSKLTTHDAQVQVAQYKYNKAVASAKAKGEPIPPKPAILAGP